MAACCDWCGGARLRYEGMGACIGQRRRVDACRLPHDVAGHFLPQACPTSGLPTGSRWIGARCSGCPSWRSCFGERLGLSWVGADRVQHSWLSALQADSSAHVLNTRRFCCPVSRNLNYWDSVSTLAGEVQDPSRTFPRALAGAGRVAHWQ